MTDLCKKLITEKKLEVEEYEKLITNISDVDREELRKEAVRIATSIYGKEVYMRGLIEFTNICKNDCYYCGIRAGNKNCERYRLTKEEIYECAKLGYELGFRTIVLQGGEDLYYTDDLMVEIISTIRKNYPDAAITLSIGEKEKETYQKYFDAGANRYLLRHEAANKKYYEKIHPSSLSFDHRMKCLRDLRDIGFQVGAGFMVGSPYQTKYDLAMDLKFIEEFKPEMCGIGPFIPHKDTPYRDEPAGTVEDTLLYLSIVRIIDEKVLLPATTALGTIKDDGREKGVLCGANVVMPNISPLDVRQKYMLYDNKVGTTGEAEQNIKILKDKMASIGYELVNSRGDCKK